MDGAVLILGGYGNAGRAIADLLARETGVTMILAGRQLQQAQALAGALSARYGGRRVLARHADAADVVSLRKAFEGVALTYSQWRKRRSQLMPITSICCSRHAGSSTR
ncbi:MAG: KR domain-containing protein [Bryobacterales bacterium]|nr:KR domain-containing protein [Bryobacterales bacterium]